MAWQDMWLLEAETIGIFEKFCIGRDRQCGMTVARLQAMLCNLVGPTLGSALAG